MRQRTATGLTILVTLLGIAAISIPRVLKSGKQEARAALGLAAKQSIDSAVPKIMNSIASGRDISLDESTESLSRNLTDAAKELEKTDNFSIEFKELNGELKVSKSTKFLGIEFKGGEINVYKIAAASGAGIYACQNLRSHLSERELSNCVEIALDSAVRKLYPHIETDRSMREKLSKQF